MADHHNGTAFERVVFFSDAVFAIAITLLVLEIRVPHLEHGASDRAVLVALLALLPNFIGFVFSFLVIGSMWIEHHRIFRFISGYDGGLLWRNMILLLTVAFMPFPTALYTENHQSGLALAIYATCFGLVGLSKVWVWRYAAKDRRLLNEAATPAVVRSISRRSWAVPITCFAVAIAGGAGVPAAYVGFALVPLVAWLLDRPERPAKRKGAVPA